ncbi:MAG: hypothetical protein ACK4Z6_04145 [Candidatus Methylomirabilales bacterium]
MHRVITVDPEGLLGQELKSFLARHGFQLLSARDPSEAARAVEGGKAQIVLLCLPPEEKTETLLLALEELTKGLALKQEQERLLEEIGHQRFALAIFNEVGKALTSTLKLHEVRTTRNAVCSATDLPEKG